MFIVFNFRFPTFYFSPILWRCFAANIKKEINFRPFFLICAVVLVTILNYENKKHTFGLTTEAHTQ